MFVVMSKDCDVRASACCLQGGIRTNTTVCLGKIACHLNPAVSNVVVTYIPLNVCVWMGVGGHVCVDWCGWACVCVWMGGHVCVCVWNGWVWVGICVCVWNGWVWVGMYVCGWALVDVCVDRLLVDIVCVWMDVGGHCVCVWMGVGGHVCVCG